MKNKQFAIGLTLGIAVVMCIAAAEYDLQKGVDLSAKTSVTASQLNQLVDNGTVAANKGMLIYSATTPDTTNNARYSRFIWLDTSFSPPVPKVYYTNGAYWTNITAIATIADNSVTAGKLANNSVYATNLTASSVTASKIADGVIESSKYANASISNTHIASLTIQSTNIANGQILSTNIGAAAILGYHLASGQISTANLTNGFLLQGTNIANGTITSANVAQAGVAPTNLAASPTALYIPRVNGATTAFEWTSPGLIQSVSTNTGALVTCSTAIPIDDTIPQNTEGDQVFSLSITPKSATSKLVITFTGHISAAGNGFGAAALFQDSTANALAATSSYVINNTCTVPLTFRHVMTSGTTSATTFKVRVGGALTVYLNASGSSRIFGGVSSCSFTIEEIF